MNNGLLDQLLDDPEAVFGDATVRTRFDTAAINITESDSVADPDPDPGVEEGEVELRHFSDENEIFDGENPITEALEAATPGDTIFVGPGTFETDLTITTENIVLTCESTEETTIVGQIVIEAESIVVSNFEIESIDGRDEIIDVSANASDITIEGCEFTVTTKITRVIIVRNDKHITIEGCDFEVVEGVTIERSIVVEDSAVNVNIIECVFIGGVESEVIVLEADDSRIEGCDFSDVTEITAQLVLIDANDTVVIDCNFNIGVEIEQVILVQGGSDVTIDDCDFEIIGDVTIKRFIAVYGDAVSVVIVRCVFIGTVTVTTIEHKGGGDSKIKDCEIDNVELDGDATLIIRIQEVVVTDVDVNIVELELEDEIDVFDSLETAIEAAEKDATITVGPGEYDGGVDDSFAFIDISTEGLDLIGPQAGTHGDDTTREFDDPDPDSEAILNMSLALSEEDITIDGFAFTGVGDAILFINDVTATVRNNIVSPIIDDQYIPPGIYISAHGEYKIDIEDNFIEGTSTGIILDGSGHEEGIDPKADVQLAENTVEDLDTGISVTLPNSELFPPSDSSDTESPVQVLDNELNGNDVGIELISDGNKEPGAESKNFVEDNNEFKNNNHDLQVATTNY